MQLFMSRRALLVFALGLSVVVSGRVGSGQGRGPSFKVPADAPPLGLGLGNARDSEVMDRIVDRSSGHVPVDPNTLHPPALSPDSGNGFVWHAPKPYTCWVVEPGEERDYAPGTAVGCFVEVTLADQFVNGDGSLAGDPAGKPDNFFGYDCPQGFSVMDFTRNRWTAVRYFDKNLNHMGTIRAARYDGVNYNFTTGKSVNLRARFIEIDTMQPVDGTAHHEFSKFLGSDYGPVTGPHGQLLANSAGRIDYSPNFGTLLYMAGPHPLDVFFFGDPSGVLPVCNALQ
jgi:hypothetical protein